jgi:putative ABC transport system substrate-binding protein
MLFALCSPTHAQQTGKIFRIGFLDNSTAAGSAVLMNAFRQELSKLGWVEGKNIATEYRFAQQKNEHLPELAVDLVRLKVDLIVVSGTIPALAAKKATTTIPIVMTTAGDPVGAGLVASLARPGGNVTGLASLSFELNTKRLEILKDAMPKLARVGLLWPSGSSDLSLIELRPANRKAKAGRRDPDDLRSPIFRRTEANRRACRQIPVACYLLPEGVCRGRRSHVLRRGLH